MLTRILRARTTRDGLTLEEIAETIVCCIGSIGRPARRLRCLRNGCARACCKLGSKGPRQRLLSVRRAGRKREIAERKAMDKHGRLRRPLRFISSNG